MAAGPRRRLSRKYYNTTSEPRALWVLYTKIHKLQCALWFCWRVGDVWAQIAAQNLQGSTHDAVRTWRRTRVKRRLRVLINVIVYMNDWRGGWDVREGFMFYEGIFRQTRRANRNRLEGLTVWLYIPRGGIYWSIVLHKQYCHGVNMLSF